MPELPEVETLKRELAKFVKDKKIKSVKVHWPKMVQPLTPVKFQNRIKNKTIIDIKRRAKMLIFELSDSNFLTVHLKMTGQLIFQPKKGDLVFGGHPQQGGTSGLPNKFTHVVIDFSDGTNLFFNDMRKFGWMRYVNAEELYPLISHFGVEPLSKSFSLSAFKLLLGLYPNRIIKQFLFDQGLVAGLGNIYIDEACHYAGILPTRRVATLTSAEVKRLHQGIQDILKLSISKKGTSFSDYVQLDGKQGQFVKWLKVYNKAGQKCQRCGTPITKIKLNGRGTHFCSKCQK